MMCYRDRTWCTQTDCAMFGTDCDRSLTEEVMEKAFVWWNGENSTNREYPPICTYAGTPNCFQEKQ